MAVFVLIYWLRELLLSMIANHFELRCQLKQLLLFYCKICPRCGLATSLSFFVMKTREGKRKKGKRTKESRKDRLVTLVHPIVATFKFFYSPDNILYGE